MATKSVLYLQNTGENIFNTQKKQVLRQERGSVPDLLETNSQTYEGHRDVTLPITSDGLSTTIEDYNIRDFHIRLLNAQKLVFYLLLGIQPIL